MNMIKIVTFNVNSLSVRLDILREWLNKESPDVVLLQELKTTEENFPYLETSACGYNAAVYGQKAYNGVAILAKKEIKNVKLGMDNEQARFIKGEIDGVTYASVYVPNGNPKETKLEYKLKFLDWLYDQTETMLKERKPFLIGGDFNVIVTDDDVYNPKSMKDDALTDPQVRAKFRSLTNMGMTNALKKFPNENNRYSFWHYMANAFERDHGMLIDHILLSPQLADRLKNARIDKTPRGKERPSDHTPLIIELE